MKFPKDSLLWVKQDSFAVILKTELYQICVWAQNLVVPFIACPCLVSHLLHDPGSLHSSAWAATPAFNSMAVDTKSLVVDRKLDKNSSITFHLNYNDLLFSSLLF